MMNRFFGTDDNADGDRGAAESALPTVAARRIGAPDAKSTAPRSGRIAMVVGNAAYAGGQLKNPLNDANLVATVLDGLGFDVEQVTDAGKSALEFAIVAFGSRLRQAGWRRRSRPSPDNMPMPAEAYFFKESHHE